ncbi:hypothetical protein MCOR07_002050 [Pyricularia oryzae]|nr:hypothetical protein MCOR01_004592 [Pyricularia oryzae]KAI6627232.1 hypothetical protein MCOR07_002050 [Pyricularia oryzae]
MKGFLGAAVMAGWATIAGALPTITAHGNKFFTSEGKQFIMKGIAYQLVEDDPLVDTEQCRRDAQLMATLGANVIRVYHVDPLADHTGCMAEFANVGIYTLIDLDTFTTYILPNELRWTQAMHDAYSAVMDAFSSFDNSLGFFVGNEIISTSGHSQAAPFIKAAARDMKAYRDSKGYRNFPVGYSAADIAELRPMLRNYLTCGGDESQNVDFFALNSYSWCDVANYNTSGYVALQEQAKNFPVPIFFSETGCNVPGPRLFEDQAAIFGPDMINDWSGSLIYEWIEEANHYGLISYGPPVDPMIVNESVKGGFVRKGQPTPVAPDFENLKAQWAKVTAAGIMRADYTPTAISTRECPTATPGGWLVNGNVALPAVGDTFTGGFQPAPRTTPTGSGLGTRAEAPAPSGSKDAEGSASSEREIMGMGYALVAVMLAFVIFA